LVEHEVSFGRAVVVVSPVEEERLGESVLVRDFQESGRDDLIRIGASFAGKGTLGVSVVN
jgi:hypothetical protein